MISTREAVGIALQAIEAAYACIVEGAPAETLCNVLKDRAYDTGMSEGHEVRYFDIIYEEETNEAL